LKRYSRQTNTDSPLSSKQQNKDTKQLINITLPISKPSPFSFRLLQISAFYARTKVRIIISEPLFFKGEKMTNHLSRRTFIAGSALLGAAVIPMAHALPTKPEKSWDMSFDMVIVGGGAAGFSAACQALDKGLKVALLEKLPMVGGSTVLSGGQWAACGTAEQIAKGVKDDEETFFNDMRKVGGNQNDPDLVRAFIKESRRRYDWVTKELGVKPKALMAASGMSVPRAHTFTPSEIIEAMQKYAKGKGLTILLNTKAERLTWDDKKGRINGVKASRKGKTLCIEAKKGVLLAAGGFSQNKKMLSRYSEVMANASAVSSVGCNGEGILMAQAYGADMIDTNYIKATYGFKEHPEKRKGATTVYYSGAIMINLDGKRFVNESISYKILGDKALAQKEGKSFLLFDEAIRKAQMAKRPGDKALWAPYDEGKETDFSFRGSTIEEVAQKAGLDPAAVRATVDRYNKFVEEGSDKDFGRNSLTSTYGKPVKIENGPFYIFPSVAALIATYCGVKINPKAQVIDVFGDVIPGLYAAGEMTGGVHGVAYMTGTSVGKAISFGSIAARSIAEENV
jgi:fumarate reductase flavoprotein subunit